MTARSVLLAIATSSFLRGDEPLQAGRHDSRQTDDGNEGSLARRWRACDQRAQLSLASANPQVQNVTTIISSRSAPGKMRPLVSTINIRACFLRRRTINLRTSCNALQALPPRCTHGPLKLISLNSRAHGSNASNSHLATPISLTLFDTSHRTHRHTTTRPQCAETAWKYVAN